ncbi:MAG: MBL fold metallo-hydrolase [Ktedonobacterales bacterium]|nr:MBL fold metallo-hydrolase [Ktedonobacterales bacterium]
MARLIFLGTAAALPQADRANTMLAVFAGGPEDATAGLLVDCGSGVYDALLRANIGPDAISDLYITHAHIDHIGGLPSLIESYRLGGRRAPLRIWALPEVVEVAQRIVEVFGYELTLESWTFPLTFTGVEEGDQLTLGGMPARIARMRHTVPAAGIRLALPGGDLTYTSDTQPNPAIQRLGAGTRLLITECTFTQRAIAEARQSKHMTATEAGEQATACQARMLALVHVGLSEHVTVADLHAEAAQSFAGQVLIPRDGERLDL